MYSRVPQAIAQFVLKTEKSSNIMGTAPILEMSRTYGLRPRLWLLIPRNDSSWKWKKNDFKQSRSSENWTGYKKKTTELRYQAYSLTNRVKSTHLEIRPVEVFILCLFQFSFQMFFTWLKREMIAQKYEKNSANGTWSNINKRRKNRLMSYKANEGRIKYSLAGS